MVEDSTRRRVLATGATMLAAGSAGCIAKADDAVMVPYEDGFSRWRTGKSGKEKGTAFKDAAQKYDTALSAAENDAVTDMVKRAKKIANLHHRMENKGEMKSALAYDSLNRMSNASMPKPSQVRNAPYGPL